jgi:hypothetical protein
MPPPSEPTEAYFVGIVFSHSRKELEAHFHQPDSETNTIDPSALYFTLEMSLSFTKKQLGPFFCGRTPDNRHQLYWEVAKPELDLFIEALTQQVKHFR